MLHRVLEELTDISIYGASCFFGWNRLTVAVMLHRVVERKWLTLAVLLHRVCWTEVTDSSSYGVSSILEGSE